MCQVGVLVEVMSGDGHGDPILNAFGEVEDCRLARNQAWDYSEQNYWDTTYQTALIAWDEAVERYNSIIRNWPAKLGGD